MCDLNDNEFLKCFGGLTKNYLTHILNVNIDANDEPNNEQPEILKHSPYFTDEGLINELTTKTENFTILSLNCQSLNAKIDNLKILVHKLISQHCRIDVVCLQETWLSDQSDTSLLNINGYNLISNGFVCSIHAGLSIYLKDEYKHQHVNLYTKNNVWEGQFIEVSGGPLKRKIIIGNIYRPPKTTADNSNFFFDELTHILNFLEQSHSEAVIAGDFNIDLLKVNENSTSAKFFDTITAHTFFPKITLPTRFSDQNGTLIDNFLCKYTAVSQHTTAGILTNCISDHQPYFICFHKLKSRKTPTKCISLKKEETSSVLHFKNDIRNAHIYDMLNTDVRDNPNNNYSILERNISLYVTKHFTHKNIRYHKHKHKKSSWITPGIIHSIGFRDKMYRRLKQTPSNSIEFITLKINLRTYNRILKRSINIAKQTYYKSVFENCKHDIKGTWSAIKDILNKSQQKRELPNTFKIDGELVSDKHNIADRFNTFFTNIGPNLASKIEVTNNNFKDYLLYPSNTIIKLDPIDINVTEKIIDELKSKSSCGEDGLSVKLLKLIKEDISKSITLVINQSINTGIFPETLKIAKVIPIFKKGDETIFDNYRPISILPAISKVFEKVLFKQLHKYFHEQKLYYDNQYGFRENHSTELAALELIDRITQLMDKGEIPLNIYLDLSKAFDTLNHEILLYKLNYYGIKGTAYKLIKSYLSNRKQYVEFSNTKSETNEITTGVPQGSILGPLLFVIYINDIANASTLFNTIIYADDTTLTGNLSSFKSANSSIAQNINNELKKVTTWLQVNKLSLNVQKTKLMIFHTPQREVDIPPIQISGVELNPVDDFNFLGIIINKHMNWNSHANTIANNLRPLWFAR